MGPIRPIPFKLHRPPKPSWRQQESESHVRHSFRDENHPAVAYHPRRCREIILGMLNREDWVGFCEIRVRTGMPVRLVSQLLDKMVGWGRIREHPLYYVKPGQDRLKHPGYGAYQGFESGYQLTEKPPLMPARKIQFTPPPPPRPNLAALERYITEGRRIEFTFEMKVCELHAMWDGMWSRAERVAEKLRRFAGKCEGLQKAEIDRQKKRHWRELAWRAHGIAGIARSLPEALFIEAQEKFSAKIGAALTEDDHDNFWQDVSHRPGIEQTWNLMLAEVLAHFGVARETLQRAHLRTVRVNQENLWNSL